MVKNGITIVSGLAKGIDVSAHKAALDLSLDTIAVIGTHLKSVLSSRKQRSAVRDREERLSSFSILSSI